MQKLIGDQATNRGCTVVNMPDDADVGIVTSAVQIAHTETCCVIGEDTDLLVLLVYYTDLDSRPVYFRSDRTGSSPTNVHEMKRKFGDDFCREILFIHAFSGCDSTSRIHSIGKQSIVNKKTTPLYDP